MPKSRSATRAAFAIYGNSLTRRALAGQNSRFLRDAKEQKTEAAQRFSSNLLRQVARLLFFEAVLSSPIECIIQESQTTFRRRNLICTPRVDGDRLAQCKAERLEDGFMDVMPIFTVVDLHMQVHRRVDRQFV